MHRVSISRADLKECPVCYSNDLEQFFDLTDVPVHANLLWTTHTDALSVPKGDIRLAFCRRCGHIFNLAFNPELMKYTEWYENSLHFSSRFQSYARSLADHLIERYDLHDKDIIEIGSGRGDFLSLLCELGENRGVGFDPGYADDGGSSPAVQRVTFVQDYFSEQYARYKADFICSRQTLEHIFKPREFMGMLRRSIGERENTVVFFEVPNVLFTLHALSIWDLIYEHFSYFSAHSLEALFRLSGFEPLEVSESFEGQYLAIEARPCSPNPDLTSARPERLTAITRDVEQFVTNFQSKTGRWQNLLDEVHNNNRRTVVWGAGSKGVTFLNMLKVKDEIRYVVDINPRKQGMFVAGSGQQIIPPEKLQEFQPELVIVMNPVYQNEITETLRSLGLGEVEMMQA